MADNASTANTIISLVKQDVADRSKWADRDKLVLQKRLSERKKKRNKPYPNAPNAVEPIIDDTTRDKTDQEVSMLANARRLAHIIPMASGIPEDKRAQAEIGFDSFLRYMLCAPAKIENALDTKNARGFSTMKIFRKNFPRWGVLPNFQPCDIRRIIVPSETEDILEAERITEILPRMSERKLRDLAEERPTLYEDNLKKILDLKSADTSKAGDEDTDTLEITKTLAGIETGGEANKGFRVWEHYCYADAWLEGQDRTKRIVKGDKVRVLFCPDTPEYLLEVEPWREEDREEPLSEEEARSEMMLAMMSSREPILFRTVKGASRRWPYIQARYENRSLNYYDSRGIGHLCMDDQIIATAETNAKLTIMDYTQTPFFKGTGSRVSTNITHEPGSFLPDNVDFAKIPDVPQQFDFDVEMRKRNAGRRTGAMNQYQMSGDLSSKKRVQKTATEVQADSMQGTMVSSASVDRFNTPWAELFMQLWEDLKRLGVKLPLVDANKNFIGEMPTEIYDWPVLIVPASSAKTLNPDQQFVRDSQAWSFATSQLANMGVTLDAQAAAMDILSSWDAFKAGRWVVPPGKQGAQGQQPVYKTLEMLQQQIMAIAEAVKAIGQSHLGDGPTEGMGR